MANIFLIKEPLITEKATELQAARTYVFVVSPSATKPEIKKAVKELYRVDPQAVRIVNTPGKSKRFRNVKRRTGGFKKAIVTLSEGQKIDLGR